MKNSIVETPCLSRCCFSKISSGSLFLSRYPNPQENEENPNELSPDYWETQPRKENGEWAKKWGTKDVYDYLIEKETADAKLFEVTASTSFESLCKIVKDTKNLYNAGEKIICTAKGRRQLIEANAKGVSFSVVQ